jgi:hypothetical protein
MESNMGKKSLLFISVVWIGMLMAASCVVGPQQFYDNGVPDEEYVSIASKHPEARLFLEEYPQAEILVDRSGRLAVDFRVTHHPATSTAEHWEGIRLRVFIDPKTNQPLETLVQCNDKFIEKDVERYLEQYFETQSCS